MRACFSSAVFLLLLIMKCSFEMGLRNVFFDNTTYVGFRELILIRFLSTKDHHVKIKAKLIVHNIISCLNPFYVTGLFLYPLKISEYQHMQNT